jgi:hypothetical protein
MHLPFTEEQFLDLFAAYNAAVWPALAALWLASAVVCVLMLAARRPPDRVISALLAAHWFWSGLAYHAAFFARINPAAWVFAALFLFEGALFLRAGVIRQRLSFARWRSKWSLVAWLLVAYSLVYPAINAVEHFSVMRIPTFGVPCPTTIFTAGLLMLAAPTPWRLTIVPTIWSAIGGSAAFLLGVRADYALPIAGLVLAMHSVRQPRALPQSLATPVALGARSGEVSAETGPQGHHGRK